MTLILGLDPSLSCTGWGVIRAEGSRIVHIANGQVPTDPKAPMARRLAGLQAALADVIAAHRPDRAAAEQVFVNKNPQSTLKLAQARGCVLAACGAAGLAVNEHRQVLDQDNAPIAGLYAAGATGQGGLLLEGHGHHLGWGFTSGRIAGQHAAAAGSNDGDMRPV